jgi:hypothetical protein
MFWMNAVGGLQAGVKLWGDTEITKDEMDMLRPYAPEHRAVALPILRRKAEYDEVSTANTAAVIDEVMKSDAADKAQAAWEAAEDALVAARQVDPDASTEAYDAARAAYEEACTAVNAAAAITVPLQVKLREFQELFKTLPPTMVVID